MSLTHFLDKVVQDWGFFRDQQKVKIMKVLTNNDFATGNGGNTELSCNIDKFAKLIRAFETHSAIQKPVSSGNFSDHITAAPVICLSDE